MKIKEKESFIGKDKHSIVNSINSIISSELYERNDNDEQYKDDDHQKYIRIKQVNDYKNEKPLQKPTDFNSVLIRNDTFNEDTSLNKNFIQNKNKTSTFLEKPTQNKGKNDESLHSSIELKRNMSYIFKKAPSQRSIYKSNRELKSERYIRNYNLAKETKEDPMKNEVFLKEINFNIVLKEDEYRYLMIMKSHSIKI